MLRTLAGLLLLSSLLACGGPREPGPHANERLVWRIDSFERSFGAACTDLPAFREDLSSFAVEAGSYIAYAVDGEAASAKTMLCTSYDPSSCEVDPQGVTLTVSGNTLLFSEAVSSDIENSECRLELNATWNLEDQGEAMGFEVVFLYSLIDSPSDCPTFQQAVIAESNNAQGIDGCAVTLSMTGSLPNAR